MRHAAHIDSTQGAIVTALRAVGASVLFCHQLGKGAPDLLVGYRGRDQLLELKTPGEKPTNEQLGWHSRWKGRRVAVVTSPQEALAAIGATR